ncbi:energy-coupling factor transporter ATPase [Bacillus shivajii]|uniref:energy-coupling factor transporter ATPase n=1 Tax=Bacillus shivajii TaxID=1983719 RepID=UPI001CFB2D6B|nr:energy-coupling factor transporter ATPase [Bacillus shivajii]UCZ53398.1 energy-coupling factor transporter ATPase [Bacillus shivajii]
MENEMIYIKDLSFRYREQDPLVLNAIDLSIYEGEWITILGHNGSGKSTLAKFFIALYTPDENMGQVIVNGFDSSTARNLTDIRRSVAMVFQNPDNQIVAPTVRDDIAFGLENAGIPRHEMLVRVSESIEKLGLAGLEDEEPHRLSGGQKQRIAIAGAFALKPKVIVLDEATSMLDPSGRKEVLDIARTLQQNEKMTIVTITHDVTEALYSDRVIILKQGELLYDLPPKELFNHLSALEQSQLKPPFLFEVIQRLKERDIELPNGLMSEEELVNAICTLKQTK